MALALTAAAVAPRPAHADPTVADTVADGTLVLGAADLVAPPTEPAPAPVPEGPRHGLGGRPRRRVLLGAVLAGLALLVVFAFVRWRSGDRTPSLAAGGPSSTRAPVTTTVAPATGLVQQLRVAARRLGSGDGSPAANLASRLEGLADQVQAGGGGSDATALLATTVGLARAGQLSAAEATTVVEVLTRVPGIDRSVVDALTATLAPGTTTPSPTRAPGKEKGKD